MERMQSIVTEGFLQTEKEGQYNYNTGDLTELVNPNFLRYQKLIDQIDPVLKVLSGKAKEQEM